MNTGSRLKRIRKLLKLTQQELADTLEVKWHKIKDIEANKLKLTPELAELIEQKYSISGWWLLTGKGEMFIDNNMNNKNIEKELIEAFKKLPTKKQKIYFHKILADALEYELYQNEK